MLLIINQEEKCSQLRQFTFPQFKAFFTGSYSLNMTAYIVSEVHNLSYCLESTPTEQWIKND